MTINHSNEIYVTQAVVLGSFSPFAMFIAWNTVVIGIIDPDSDGVNDPMAMLRNGSSGTATAAMASIFGMLAVITSFIGFVIGLMSFYRDILPNRQSKVAIGFTRITIAS